jgi:hypothetical protein
MGENGTKCVGGSRVQAVLGARRGRRQKATGGHTAWPEVKLDGAYVKGYARV